MDPIIQCSNVSKSFRWRDRNLSLKRFFTSAFRRTGSGHDWEVLEGITFSINRGERVAIVGQNGSGKTTLLRMIAGIYKPSSGLVKVSAKRALALLELGVGFYPDLTGRENVRLNWVFNGLGLKELAPKFQEIVEFSGIGASLDTQLKYYSSGMRARLGFAIAAHADPDLLVMDEVLAVGDASFQTKCRNRVSELCSAGTTLLLVSHNPSDVLQMCTRALWLNQGSVAFDGPPEAALSHYARSTS